MITTIREFQAITHENGLPETFAKLAGYMMELGMNYARVDDPNLHRRATQWLADAGGRYQLRVDVEPGQVRTCGLICDPEGEAVIELFTIVARSGDGNPMHATTTATPRLSVSKVA